MPCEQIPISSVTVQNPPALLPPRSVCPLPICPSCRCRSQPLPGVSRKQRYNTLDFPTENRVPTGGAARPYWKPRAKGKLFPSGHPACPCSGYPSCFPHAGYAPTRTGKTGTEICPIAGKSLCLFLFSGGWAKHTRKPCRTLGLSWRFSYWSAKTDCPNSLYLV